MKDLINTPVFGIIISILAYEVGLLLQRKTKLSIFNPLLIGILLVIGFLPACHISLDTYNKGGDFISFFLGPATVVLSVPLYKQLQHLKANLIPILGGITMGCITALCSVFLLSKLFGLSDEMYLSLLPKSITTPIGIEVSRQIGGIPSVTVAAIIITGIMGAVIAPFICKIFRITDPVATGIAIGTSSHAVGTSKAVELGETQGAMSGLAIGIAGLITVFLAPIFVHFT